jgi:hypothetical protein
LWSAHTREADGAMSGSAPSTETRSAEISTHVSGERQTFPVRHKEEAASFRSARPGGNVERG